jgi:hypothetical protein
MSLTKSGLFKERFLFCRHASIEQAVRTYFTQLETLGMIRRVSAYTFRVAPLADRISRSVEDCLNEDRLVIDFLINNTERQGIPSEKD